jgi:VNT family MFS transporter (synaptic vesicle glycoprotein 2)
MASTCQDEHQGFKRPAISKALALSADGFAAKVGVALCVANACDAMETLSAGYMLPQLRVVFPEHTHYITTAVYVGMLIGSVSAGYAGKLIGPQRLLVTALALEALSAFVGATSNSGLVFAAWRLVAGVAVGISVPPLFGLAEELLEPEQRRHRWLNLVATTFITGTISAAFMAYLSFDVFGVSWRGFYALTGIVPLVGAVLVHLCVPESPDHLATNGRTGELTSLLGQLDPSDDITQDDVTPLMHGSGAAVVPETAASTWPFSRTSKEKTANSSAALCSAPLVFPFVRLMLAAFGVSFAWYGMGTWLLVLFDAVGVENVYLAGIMFAISGIPGCFCRHLLIGVASPRRLYAGALAASSLCCLALYAILRDEGGEIKAQDVHPVLAAFFVCLFNSVSTSVFNVQVTVWASPFPTQVQKEAIGWQSAFMRVASIIAQVVDGELLKAKAPATMTLVNAGVLAVSALACVGLWIPGDSPSSKK